MSQLNRIKDILVQKNTESKLGHFYLVSPSHNDTENLCYNWSKELVIALSGSSKSIENLTDVMLIDKSQTTEKQYKIDDIESINSFLNYKAIELGRKYLIINEAHKLTHIHANKLLKTLEEPPIALTILLINNRRTKLLDTIESRAIKLRLPIKPAASTNYLNKVLSDNMSYSQFCQDAQNNEVSIESLVQEVLGLANQLELPYNSMSKIIETTKLIQDDLTFHTSKNNVLFKVYECVNLLK